LEAGPVTTLRMTLAPAGVLALAVVTPASAATPAVTTGLIPIDE
jgi:hypothetical protein